MNRLKDLVDPISWAVIPCVVASVIVLAPMLREKDVDAPPPHGDSAHAGSTQYAASHPLPKRVSS